MATKIKTESEKIGNILTVTSPSTQAGRTVKTIFYNYVPVAHFDIESKNERKIAVINLVEREFCSQSLAGKLCGFHRNSVSKFLELKKHYGISAVLEDNRGRKEPLKFKGEILSHIQKLLAENPGMIDEDIAIQAAKDLDIEISRSSVARIRTVDQNDLPNLPSKKELLDLAREAEAAQRTQANQLTLWANFGTEPELKKHAEQYAEEPALEAKGEAQQTLITDLQQGVRCTFAGGFMHHLFLQEIDFQELMAPFPFNPGATYQSIDIMTTVFHSITWGITSLEALKLVNASEFGLLIGGSRAPDKVTLRDHLAVMAKLYLSSDIARQFAAKLLENEMIDWEVFFIDGHFLPYYGLHVIAKGYFTVRRMAMKGNELFMITDLTGKPLFSITESCEIDFRPIISRSAAILKDFGVERPILVFDRGGYGVYFFSQLGLEADFVTWTKYVSNESLESVAENSCSACMFIGGKYFEVYEQQRVVSESAATAKKDGRETICSLELRLIVLKDVVTGKTLGIYTNNNTKPAYDIAYYMLQRWGKSENVYKELIANFNLDYHPGYDIKELEQQPLVDNPDIAMIKQAIKVLKKEVGEVEKDITLTDLKLKDRRDKRLDKKSVKLQKEVAEKKEDILQFEQKLTTLPDKIEITELLNGKIMGRCDLEKKKLYDLMQFMAYHSRERLVEILRQYYDDHRDVKKVLDMITRKAGLVKLVGKTLMIIIEWIDNSKHRQAAQKLCDELNQIGVRMTGGLDVTLSFHIAKIP
jgi:hypothetical protein